MKVLITGGAGFIAHHAILHILKNTDWEIVSLDRLDYSGNLNRIADIMSDLDSKTKKRLSVKVDRNPDFVENIRLFPPKVEYILIKN